MYVVIFILFDNLIWVYLWDVELGFLGVIVVILVYILCLNGVGNLWVDLVKVLKLRFKVGVFCLCILFFLLLIINWFVVGILFFFY